MNNIPPSPLVSIIICCHNRAHILPETIQSAMEQNYRPVEIILVDDGSSDDTAALAKNYGDRVRYIHQPNQGVAVARTTGARAAKGEFIAYLDDDDRMPPRRISALMGALEQFPSAVAALGDWQEMDAEGNLVSRRTHFFNTSAGAPPVLIEKAYEAVLWPRITPTPHTALFRKADGDRVDWFDDSFFHACEDTDFFAKLAGLGPMVYVPEVVSHYRVNHDSLSRKRVKMAYSQSLLMKKHLQAGAKNDSELKARLQQRLFQCLKALRAPYIHRSHRDGYFSKQHVSSCIALLPIHLKIKYAVSLLIALGHAGK